MRTNFLSFLALFLLSHVSIISNRVYGAVDQPLNFFINPAELKQTEHFQLIGGNLFMMPHLYFKGKTPLGTGKVKSRVHDSLPFLLTSYRLNERFVIGVNITPSVYGHLEWPKNSILRNNSTTTYFLYYRGSLLLSYQINNSLFIGLGINLEYNKLGELDFFIGERGNQINKIKGRNYTGDLGLYYKVNSSNYLTLAFYTGVNTYGYGTSSLENAFTPNFSLNIIQAPVGYLGLQHWFSKSWMVEGKLYWSGWSIEKNVNFINTTTGTSLVSAKWKDTWSYQLNTRYSFNEKIAFLGSILYETNAAPISTNAIGYPLANSGFLSTGLDLQVKQNVSIQLSYGYGRFIPRAIIASSGSSAKIRGIFQSAMIQLSYKV